MTNCTSGKPAAPTRRPRVAARRRFVLVIVGLMTGCGNGTELATQASALDSSWVPGAPRSMLNLRRVKVNGIDFMTTNNVSERDWVRTNGGWSDGSIAYVPRRYVAGTGTIAMYRLWATGGIHDHMDSTSPNEGSPYYLNEGDIAYPWSSRTAVAGLGELVRAPNASGDHGLWSYDTSPPPQSYSPIEWEPFYGYPRYGTGSFETNYTRLQYGDLTIESSKVFGGAVVRYYWRGYQFLNHHDGGRMMQSDLTLLHPSLPRYVNPTEAADCYSTPPGRLGGIPLHEDLHGSPLLQLQNVGANVQTSKAIPVAYGPGGERGCNPDTLWCEEPLDGSADNPVVFTSMTIGKTVTLGFAGDSHVARYVAQYEYPIQIQSAHGSSPVLYLRANFNTFYGFDPTVGSSGQTTVGGAVGSGCRAVAAVSADNHAIAVYGCDPAHGGTTYRLGSQLLTGPNPDTSETGNDTAILSSNWMAQDRSPALPGTSSAFTSYIVTGTFDWGPDDIRNSILGLYRRGYR